MYLDSLVVQKSDFRRWADWTNRMARKIAEVSHEGLEKFTISQGISLTPERKQAADSLVWLD